MDVVELCNLFPEIPAELRSEPLLAEFAEKLDDVLREARRPSPCSTDHDRANHFYLKLVGPMDIYRYGLMSRDRLLSTIQDYLTCYADNPDSFWQTLLPEHVAAQEVRRPGCET